jgi:hypothetical protein
MQLVEQLGTDSWENVAARIRGRTVRQCSSRWKHYVSGRTADLWTREEDDFLWEKVAAIGPKWTQIGTLLHNRTDMEARARWKYLYKKRHHSSFREACSESRRGNMTLVRRRQTRGSDGDHGDGMDGADTSQLCEYQIGGRLASDHFASDDEIFWESFRDQP